MYGFLSFLAYAFFPFPGISDSTAPQHISLTYLECEYVVGEHNHFVSPVLVVLDKELTRLELSWIHTVEEHAFT